jgi:hypothetical protein
MTNDFTIPFCLFPSPQWFALCNLQPRINLNEIYLKQTYRNRYDVLAVNGRLSLTVPVNSQKGIKTPLKDIRISDRRWHKQHLATLRSSYGKAAYFEHYIDGLADVLLKPRSFLIDLNMESLQWIARCKIGFQLTITDEPWCYLEGDWTYRWEPAYHWPSSPVYPQVFCDRHPFEGNLSIIDVLMNKGPLAEDYIRQLMNIGIE